MVIHNDTFGIIAKYDDGGNRHWEDYFGGSSFDGFDKVQELPGNEGYIVTGSFQSVDGDLGNFNWDYGRIRSAWIKYDINGNREWLRDAAFYSPLSVEENGIVATFGSKSNHENAEPWHELNIVKFDFNGNVTKKNNINDDLAFAEEGKPTFLTSIGFNVLVKTPDGYILIGKESYTYGYQSTGPGPGLHGRGGPNLQVFIDKDFSFIKQEYSNVSGVHKYIHLDDGFIGIFNSRLTVAKFDYDMNELWSLNLEYPDNQNPDSRSNARPTFTDMIRIDSKLYIVGYAYHQRNPLMVITDLEGSLIYESGILPAKGWMHFYSDIYPYEEGYLIRSRYYHYRNGGGIGLDYTEEWLYYPGLLS